MSDDLRPEKFFEKGLERLGAGRIEQACADFCEALRLCPDVLDDIAAAFGRPADREQAVALLQESAGSDTPGAPRWALAARLARDLDRLGEARIWAERATRLEPECAAWWFERAEVLSALGEIREAAAAYRRCLALAPGHAMARHGLLLARRRRWLRPARMLARSRLVHQLLRRIAWAGRPLEILEKRDSSAAAHQMRWARALEHGSAMSLFPDTPPGMEPENFAEHMKACNCVFWRWFLEQGIDREIRTVLDVGCGPGWTTEHFLHHGLEVKGVTFNPYEKEECRLRGIEVVEADFHFLPLPDSSFDLVFSSHSLEHSTSPLFALWEWKRVLRPGGYAFIVTPMPVEQDARAIFPENYDPEIDRMDFPTTPEKTLSREEVCTSCSTYGAWLHVYVLSCWQLRWLFQLTGFERVADAVEDPFAMGVLGTEHVDGRLPRDPNHVLNGMFLLRKPTGGPARARPGAAQAK